MSTKAYQSKCKEAFSERADVCRGRCGYDFAGAFDLVARTHPEWSFARQRQRALVEMVKRGSRP
jgi:hypothetical protein